LRTFERMLEVEESEVFHTESAADDNLAGESSSAR
jgi:hypothetical protein